MRDYLAACLLVAALLSFAPPVHAVDMDPGDSCTDFVAGDYRPTGGRNNPDGAFVVCDGSIWQPILRYSSTGNAVMFASTGLAAAPLHVWGEAIIGSNGLACSSTTEGALRYSSGTAVVEVCDGSAWTTVGGGTPGNDREIVFNSAGQLATSSGFVLDPNGNLGIGTTSPDRKLTVLNNGTGDSAGLRIKTLDTGGWRSLDFGVSSSIAEIRTANDVTFDPIPILFSPAGAEAMRIMTDGKIGVGTASPQTKLHVASATESVYARVGYSGSAGSVAGISLDNSGAGGTQWSIVAGNDSTGTLGNRFGISAASASGYQLVIDQTGNVGIGTADPGPPLDVRADLGVGSGEQRLAQFRRGAGQSSGFFVGYTADGSQETGVFIRSGGSDSPPLFIAAGGSTPALTILPNGHVGIGTTPANPLHVVRSTSGSPARFESTVGNAAVNILSPDSNYSALQLHTQASPSRFWAIRAYGASYVGEGAANDLRFRHFNDGSLTAETVFAANGRVGIGTGTPARDLHVESSLPRIQLKDASASGNTARGWVEFVGSNATRLGLVGMGNNGNSNLYLTADSGDVRADGVGGTCMVNTGGCASDRELKQNIAPVQDSLQALMRVSGVSYEWRADPGTPHYGVIAQDVEPVFPALVTIDKETGYKMVNYRGLTAPMIEAIKELKAANDNQAAEIKRLEEANDDLHRRLERLEARVDSTDTATTVAPATEREFE